MNQTILLSPRTHSNMLLEQSFMYTTSIQREGYPTIIGTTGSYFLKNLRIRVRLMDGSQFMTPKEG